jgi:hypothetical protein
MRFLRDIAIAFLAYEMKGKEGKRAERTGSFSGSVLFQENRLAASDRSRCQNLAPPKRLTLQGPNARAMNLSR